MCLNSHLCLRIYQFIQPGLFIFNPNLGFKINFSNTCTGYGVYCIVLSTKFLSLSPIVCQCHTHAVSQRPIFLYLFLFYSLGGALTMWHALQLFFFFWEEHALQLCTEDWGRNFHYSNCELNTVPRLDKEKKKNKRNVTGMSLRSLFNKNLV